MNRIAVFEGFGRRHRRKHKKAIKGFGKLRASRKAKKSTTSVKKAHPAKSIPHLVTLATSENGLRPNPGNTGAVPETPGMVDPVVTEVVEAVADAEGARPVCWASSAITSVTMPGTAS